MKPHEPMLNYIRKNVERPKVLPILNIEIHHTRSLLFGKKCPMGLLPCSVAYMPSDRWEFLRTLPASLTYRKIKAFGNWWDKKQDPKRAVEAVWGKE